MLKKLRYYPESKVDSLKKKVFLSTSNYKVVTVARVVCVEQVFQYESSLASRAGTIHRYIDVSRYLA